MNIEWDAVARELVKALRGRSTQGALSRRLGFKTNVVYRWEAGLRAATADDLLALIRLRIDQSELKLWSFALGSNGTRLDTPPFEWAVWLKTLRGDQSVRDIAESLGISQQAVRRIFRGDSTPSLSRLLNLIQCLSNRIINFIELLTDSSLLKSLKGMRTLVEAQMAITFKHIHAESIIACLETRGYAELPNHSNEWIAKRLALPVEVVEETVEALVAGRGIKSRKGKYRTQDHRMANTQIRSKSDAKRLARHWTNVSMALAEERTRSGYLVFSADQEAIDEIGRIMTEAMHQVIARVAKAKSVDRVSVLTVNMSQLDQPFDASEPS